ncbi:MAG TPA: primosomal protein N', partial [Bacteroidales bacterium]|nr:primosomal protein N' [Bacteroidales bacterium]
MYQSNTLFADIILPLPISGTFTYIVPKEFFNEAEVGKRVVVQFGRTKLYTGIIKNLYTKNENTYVYKPIMSILDESPVVNEKQFKLWDWIADYYMCTIGEVMNAALPSAFKIASETKIIKNPYFDGNYQLLNDKEFLIAESVEKQKSITIKEITQITGIRKIIPFIKNLIEKGVIITEEEIKEKYHPLKIEYVRLTKLYEDQKLLNKILNLLEKKAEKQWALIISYLEMSKKFSNNEHEVKRIDLLRKTSAKASTLLNLQKKGILECYSKIESRLVNCEAEIKPNDIIFSDFQVKALAELKHSMEQNKVTLLHGITSSGKTEMYINLISKTLAEGKEVLYMLPEIALTTQAIARLQRYFGDKIGIYHSKYGSNEKIEVWNALLNKPLHNKKINIIMGARSSIFLPFTNLGLIIVDEEHDTSYKQNEPAPRYNARDTAIILGEIHNAKIILGSATPSIETFYNTTKGKAGIVNVNQRYGNIAPPEIFVVDIKKETYENKMKSIFSKTLLNNIEKALNNKEQVILFQNRRGFSPILECKICNWIPNCENCDVSLVYHKKDNKLKCHYCGYTTSIPENCIACGNSSLLMKGFGTERAEEELAVFFPTAKIARMDIDTVSTKNSLNRIISDFEEKRIDILVGTQMVTKGLDFDNVSVVGILNASNMLAYPDFRSHERSFQLMAQVAGRAGRKNKRGIVIIQTWEPNHNIIKNVVQNDYKNMYETQLVERKKFKYPPFYRLIKISLKYKEQEFLNKAAAELADRLKKIFENRI